MITDLTTYFVQAIEGRNGRFEDYRVEARTAAQAIDKARRFARKDGLDPRWTRFVA